MNAVTDLVSGVPLIATGNVIVKTGSVTPATGIAPASVGTVEKNVIEYALMDLQVCCICKHLEKFVKFVNNETKCERALYLNGL